MITNQPKKIYLQVGDIDEPTDFQELYEVTWCKDRINQNDIEYVRADLVDKTCKCKIVNIKPCP